MKLDWQQVKDLFAEVLERPENERPEFLRSACNGDEELYREVSSLLESLGEDDNFIESNAFDLAAKVGATEITYTERHFGPYRILREIGSGGMGTVFLAERDDGEFRMQVALKIVRQSVADREIIERFKRERQILANLTHQNIAALHDGGVSGEGEPFLAMEYVEGESLIDYSEENDLSIPEKLELFLKICQAVSYAHRNLVVHRDIKPSNILVTLDGEPKLLDFGLAKAFETDASTTQTALRAFTPAYASPEQILGQNITTASDIYSLGVVLYELLTGAKPLHFEYKSYDQIIETINTLEPAKPSSVATGANSVASSLTGDLDNIVLKTLRKEPERRFKTVDDLAEDIRRHLSGRPITARPNTAGYLIGKFVRRNKIAVAAAALIIASILSALGFSLRQADVARKERDRAEKRFQDVRKLSNSLLFEISPRIERLPGSVEAREMLVVRALEYLDSLAAESASDATLQAEVAAAYEKVGELQGNIDKPNLSDFSGAIRSFEKARAIRELLPPDTQNRSQLAQNYRLTASIRNRQNEVKAALSDAENARRILGELTDTAPDSLDFRLASIEAAIEHGQIYAFNNLYAEAIPRFREALVSLDGIDQNDRRSRILRAKALAFLGNALSWDGHQADAETEMSRAIGIAAALGTDFPADSEMRSVSWQTYNFASSIYEGTKDDLSLEFAKRALATAEQAVAADKADQQARLHLARAFSRVGITLSNLQQLDDASENLQRSERIFSELLEREPKNILYQRDLGKLYVRMGDTSVKKRDTQDALLKFQNSAVIFENLAGADDLNTLAQRDLAQSLRSVAKMQIALGQREDARETLIRAKRILDLLKERNALGGFDRTLITDVENTLNSL